MPVLLLALINTGEKDDMGEKDDLSKVEQNELRIELAGNADDYLKGVIEKIAALKK